MLGCLGSIYGELSVAPPKYISLIEFVLFATNDVYNKLPQKGYPRLHHQQLLLRISAIAVFLLTRAGVCSVGGYGCFNFEG